MVKEEERKKLSDKLYTMNKYYSDIKIKVIDIDYLLKSIDDIPGLYDKTEKQDLASWEFFYILKMQIDTLCFYCCNIDLSANTAEDLKLLDLSTQQEIIIFYQMASLTKNQGKVIKDFLEKADYWQDLVDLKKNNSIRTSDKELLYSTYTVILQSLFSDLRALASAMVSAGIAPSISLQKHLKINDRYHTNLTHNYDTFLPSSINKAFSSYGTRVQQLVKLEGLLDRLIIEASTDNTTD